MEKANNLLKLKQECLDCKKCPLGGKMIEGRPSNVFSNMCLKARIMVIGQNPGMTEVIEGKPFVGPSGHFFDFAISKILNIDRSFLYVSNTVKCYTIDNQRPDQSHIDSCRSFVDKEIEIVKPVLIVTLGGPALQQVTGLSGIMKYHGKIQISPRYNLPVLPLLHPSPLNMNVPAKRDMFLKDLLLMKEYINV